jgi:hypothetical protein
MTQPDYTPLSFPGPGQTLCTSQKEDGREQTWSCTREHGHELPHEAAGAGGTVYARWVDWTTDNTFDDGQGAAPVVVPAVSRPARIAALHMAGLFLAENTDLPMPSGVTMELHGLTEAQLQAMSELHGVPVRSGPTSRWVEIIVGLETLHGIGIRYLAFGKRSH